ncbi:hypothetical protein SERLA73DRAFT_44958, partial [Serpula lacrymans var. lacrymans S7.3]
HPYWYAHVIRIFHLMVCDYSVGSNFGEPQRMDVLFVHWFGRDTTRAVGVSARQLYQVRFLANDDTESFNFLDPNHVIQGVHLIPAFAYGHTDEYLGPSFVHSEEDSDLDWLEQPRVIMLSTKYVHRFVDWDMFMHFRGGGLGHEVPREWDSYLQSDCQAVQEENETFDVEKEEGDERGIESNGSEEEEEEEGEE